MIFPATDDLQEISSLIKSPVASEDLKPLLSLGLTHDHIVIGNTGWILRLPRNNQLGLSPEDYLQQQKSCYDEAQKSGVTPACCGIVTPSADLPNGALVIQYIKGRRINSENDLPAVARCLAALSSIKPDGSHSVQAAATPFGSQWFVIHDVFGKYFDSAAVDEKIRNMLKQEKDALEKEFQKLAQTNIPMGMIGGDSHLANYLMDEKGKAWFIDLEFLTYDVPAIDAADAVSRLTLPLDCRNKFSISDKARAEFYQTWLDHVENRPAMEQWIALSERTIALRTLAWMCYWTDQGKQDNKPDAESRDNWDKLCAETLTLEKLAKILSVTPQVSRSSPNPPTP